jgi:hypothetical protein
VLHILTRAEDQRATEMVHALAWITLEKYFRTHYADERACADWIDLGGEA